MAIFANDHIGTAIEVFGLYERDELDVLFDFLQPLEDIFRRGLALDVGANIGNHSVYFARIFGFVHSFEPNPSTYHLLRFNVHGLSNVMPHHIALGDERAEFRLLENPFNIGASTISSTGDELDSIVVSVERLDDLDIDLRDLCFMKMDVEGFEARVVSGGLGSIAEFQPLIVLEQHESEFQNGSTRSIAMLSDIGYKFCWHQNGVCSDNIFIRRLSNVMELFFGRTHRIISDKTVPVGSYTSLIAVPPRFQQALGI